MEIEEKIARLKEALLMLDRGESVEEIKRRFKEVLLEVKPWEIPIVEQELVRSGYDPRKIALLCEAHVEIFKESLAKSPMAVSVPEGHPVRTVYLNS